ncbi:MAG: NAD(P)/FAD-dependent oxidoreductase [Pseudomonadota bacterium]
MTTSLNRRLLLQGALAGTGLSILPLQALAQTRAAIVIIGGGFGGATAARMLKRLLPDAQVTLIEASARFTACPFSNLVIAGIRPLALQEFGYETLQREGITVINGSATDIDAASRAVTIENDMVIPYDRLILSPGIDVRWNAIEGYDEAASRRLPHAWKAGAQTALLRQQLETLENGQSVIMTIPPAPYRCPPGPYERASLIGHYLKTHKPASKLILLDGKDRFSKMDLFREAWAEHYPDQIEWRGASDDGTVRRVDPATMTVFTDFESHTAAAINVIPPQKAGWIAERAGVADATGWCPINPLSFASQLQPDIHVIGDATIAAPMPKSAFSANLQAKICAIGVARSLSGLLPASTTLANTCYSFTTPNKAISIAGVYSNAANQLQSIEGAGGVSPLGAAPSVRAAETAEATHWFETITQEAFG